MDFYASYRINSEQKLVIQYLEGDVTFQALQKFRMSVFSDPLYKPGYSRLNDFRNASFNVTPEIIKKYSAFEKSAAKYSTSKIVLLTDTPDQVATSMLYGFYSTGSSIVETFSTLESALRFLGISTNNLEQIQEEMRQLQSSKTLIRL